MLSRKKISLLLIILISWKLSGPHSNNEFHNTNWYKNWISVTCKIESNKIVIWAHLPDESDNFPQNICKWPVSSVCRTSNFLWKVSWRRIWEKIFKCLCTIYRCKHISFINIWFCKQDFCLHLHKFDINEKVHWYFYPKQAEKIALTKRMLANNLRFNQFYFYNPHCKFNLKKNIELVCITI